MKKWLIQYEAHGDLIVLQDVGDLDEVVIGGNGGPCLLHAEHMHKGKWCIWVGDVMMYAWVEKNKVKVMIIEGVDDKK